MNRAARECAYFFGIAATLALFVWMAAAKAVWA